MFDVAVSSLFTWKMYILPAIVRLWGELDTEESGGENDDQRWKDYRDASRGL